MESTGRASDKIKALKDLRTKAKLSVKEAAKLNKMSEKRYQGMEDGNIFISEGAFKFICGGLQFRIKVNKILSNRYFSKHVYIDELENIKQRFKDEQWTLDW